MTLDTPLCNIHEHYPIPTPFTYSQNPFLLYYSLALKPTKWTTLTHKSTLHHTWILCMTQSSKLPNAWHTSTSLLRDRHSGSHRLSVLSYKYLLTNHTTQKQQCQNGAVAGEGNRLSFVFVYFDCMNARFEQC